MNTKLTRTFFQREETVEVARETVGKVLGSVENFSRKSPARSPEIFLNRT